MLVEENNIVYIRIPNNTGPNKLYLNYTVLPIAQRC